LQCWCASLQADHEDLIHDVAYDFYGKRMATCSSDQTVKVSWLVLLQLMEKASIIHFPSRMNRHRIIKLSISSAACSKTAQITVADPGSGAFFWPLDPGWVKIKIRIRGEQTSRILFPRAEKQFFG
jgi:hypothetical protein